MTATKPKAAHKRHLAHWVSSLSIAALMSSAAIGTGNAQSITFWTQPQGDLLRYQDMYAQFAAEFKEQSGIDVTVEVINWSVAFTTWLAVAQGGPAPDCAGMFWLHSNVGIGGGKYGPMPINEYRDQWPNLEEDFYAGALTDVHWNGDFYGIPYRVDIRPMIMRTDWLAEAGITSAPDTWEDVITAATALTERDANGNVTRWGFRPGNVNPGQTLLPYYWQAGGLMLSEDGKNATIDNEAMRTALKYLQDLVHVHKVSSPEMFEKSADVEAEFVGGQVAMIGMGDATLPVRLDRDYPELEGKWELALNPKGPVNRDSYSGAGYWGVLHGTQQVEACVEWIKFLSTAENMQRFSETTGTASPRKDVMQSEFWSDRPWKTVQADALNHGHTSQHAASVWSALVSPSPGAVLYDLVYNTVIVGNDIDAAVKEAQTRMQAELDRAN